MESWEVDWTDYYAELRCSPDDPSELIRGIYRAIVQRYHPDRTRGDHEKMVRINAAYEILKDPVRRGAYDRAYRDRAAGAGGQGEPSGTSSPGSSSSPFQADRSGHGPSDCPSDSGTVALRPDTGAVQSTSASVPDDGNGVGPQADGERFIRRAKYRVRVDPTQAMEKLAEDSGYTVTRRSWLRDFRPTARAPYAIDVELLKPTSGRSTLREALVALSDDGYRPLDPVELIALAAHVGSGLLKFKFVISLAPWRTRDEEYFAHPYFGDVIAVLEHDDSTLKRVNFFALRRIDSFDDQWYGQTGDIVVASAVD